MSSNSKIDKHATKQQLLFAYQAIRQEVSLAEVRDPQTKINYPVDPHLRLACFYVPKKQELPQGIEGFTRQNWPMMHIMTNAAYYEQVAGYPVGKQPAHAEYCDYREDYHTVSTDCFGTIWTVDDPEVNEMYRGIFKVPASCYKDMNRQVMNAINKHFMKPLEYNESEPFGAFICLQRNVIWKLVRICLESGTEILNEIRSLEARTVFSRREVEALEMEVNTALSLQEISKMQRKYALDQLFFGNLISTLEAQEGFTKEGDRIRVARFANDIRQLTSGGGSIDRDMFFARLANCFSADSQGLADLMSDRAAMSAHHAQPRKGAHAKENINPQTGKRKQQGAS
jgi:hypothetical protein